MSVADGYIEDVGRSKVRRGLVVDGAGDQLSASLVEATLHGLDDPLHGRDREVLEYRGRRERDVRRLDPDDRCVKRYVCNAY